MERVQIEYKTVRFDMLTKPHYQQLDADKLNELGVDGWELINVFSGICVFKRPKKRGTTNENEA